MTLTAKVQCMRCSKPGTVLRAGLCARCTAQRRWQGNEFSRVVCDDYAEPFPLHRLSEDESDPTEPLPPRAA